MIYEVSYYCFQQSISTKWQSYFLSILPINHISLGKKWFEYAIALISQR